MSGIKNIKLIALDSNIFVYQFESNPHFIHLTDKIFEKIINGNTKAVTSIISVIEALSYPSPPKVLQAIEDGFNNLANLVILDVDRKIALEAARIRREYKFRLPDATQLATAIMNKAQVFITNDDRLKTFKEIKVVLLNKI